MLIVLDFVHYSQTEGVEVEFGASGKAVVSILTLPSLKLQNPLATVCVTELPPTATKESISQFFGKFGPIFLVEAFSDDQYAVSLTKLTFESYTLVHYEDPASADTAVEAMEQNPFFGKLEASALLNTTENKSVSAFKPEPPSQAQWDDSGNRSPTYVQSTLLFCRLGSYLAAYHNTDSSLGYNKDL